jgi:hypothetical protein
LLQKAKKKKKKKRKKESKTERKKRKEKIKENDTPKNRAWSNNEICDGRVRRTIADATRPGTLQFAKRSCNNDNLWYQ